MNEEFYASLKLVSGEEIFSKVCGFEENDEVLVVLDHPIFVETRFSPKLGGHIAQVTPWMKLTLDTTFIINRDKIITMTQVKDETLIQMHQRYTREHNKVTSRTKLNSDMGYVATVSDARERLEKSYNSTPEPTL